MSTSSNAGLIIASLDAAAILGVAAVGHQRLTKAETDIVNIGKEMKQTTSMLRIVAGSSKELLTLSHRLKEHDQHGDLIKELDERYSGQMKDLDDRLSDVQLQLSSMERVSRIQERIIMNQRAMIQELVYALDKAKIQFNIPREVPFVDVNYQETPSTSNDVIVSKGEPIQEKKSNDSVFSDPVADFFLDWPDHPVPSKQSSPKESKRSTAISSGATGSTTVVDVVKTTTPVKYQPITSSQQTNIVSKTVDIQSQEPKKPVVKSNPDMDDDVMAALAELNGS